MTIGTKTIIIYFDCLPFLAASIQSLVQTKASTISGSRRLRYGSTTRPPVLNADSEATVDACIANTSGQVWRE